VHADKAISKLPNLIITLARRDFAIHCHCHTHEATPRIHGRLIVHLSEIVVRDLAIMVPPCLGEASCAWATSRRQASPYAPIAALRASADVLQPTFVPHRYHVSHISTAAQTHRLASPHLRVAGSIEGRDVHLTCLGRTTARYENSSDSVCVSKLLAVDLSLCCLRCLRPPKLKTPDMRICQLRNSLLGHSAHCSAPNLLFTAPSL
jgi:hypothetical protein